MAGRSRTDAPMSAEALLPASPREGFAEAPDLQSVGRQAAMASLPRLLILAFLGLTGAVAVATSLYLEHSQQELIEFKALTVADVVSRQAAASRTVYTEQVAAKLRRDGTGMASEAYVHEPGNVPLPAQFLKLVGRQASEDSDGLYRYRPVSKWNLEPGQGLRDDFQRWAWAQLESQDQEAPAGPLEWRTVWRIEDMAGQRTLRALSADPATSQACVACHNTLERRIDTVERRQVNGVALGKQWKQHQLLGAIEVQVPLNGVESLARHQRQEIVIAVIGMAIVGTLLVGGFALAGTNRARRLTNQLVWHAGHDDLTGLVNRRQFEQRLQALLKQARAGGPAHAMMFLDLDQFKVINDTCGHQAGDALLVELSTHLRGVLRASDTLARLGGDEFGVLLPTCSREQAMGVAKKLVQATSEFRFQWQGRTLDIGVSVGLAEINADSQSVADLMSAADMACYAAKEGGRNRVRAFVGSDEELVQRREELGLGERVASALAAGRLSLAVQAARALDDSLPVLAYQELLLRIFDADGKPIPTGPAVAAAERLNMMSTKLDRWVLSTACNHLASGRVRGDARHIVAVNLSAQSLCDESFLPFALETLESSGIDPRVLCIEITETAAIANLERATEFMRALRARGCLFALDDFGAGLSSFGYLKRLEVDFLKLDGVFVRDVVKDETDRALVATMASLGQALGIRTIAEWVENDAIREEVQRLGIDYAQGWGIEKPQIV
jgi:diguanylate cyclase (GGDEF)-like protein